MEIELHRGIWITGTGTDKKTGLVALTLRSQGTMSPEI